MEFRSDSIGSKLAWEKTPHGYVAFATLAKLGHPLDYVEIEGTRQEYLGSFSEDSLNSIRGMPLCLGHPESVTYQGNKSNSSVGHFLQEILITDSGELLAPVTVTDQRGIDLIDDCLAKGLSPEISPAYWVDSVRQDSKGNLEQCRGRYDHAALLPPGQGRGGSTIALRLDRTGSETEYLKGALQMTEPTILESTKIATVALENELATLKKTVETLTGENVGLKAQLTTMGETHLSLDSINSKLKTLAQIGKINLDSIDLKVSATELQKQHIKTLNPTLDLAGKSDDYVAGVFESLVGSSVTVSAEISKQDQINSDSNVVNSTSSAAIAAAKDQLNGVRSDSTVTGDPIELAKQKRLAQIASNSQPAK